MAFIHIIVTLYLVLLSQCLSPLTVAKPGFRAFTAVFGVASLLDVILYLVAFSTFKDAETEPVVPWVFGLIVDYTWFALTPFVRAQHTNAATNSVSGR